MLPLVVTITMPEGAQQRTIAYVESPIFVGRGPLNELQLLEPWIARTEGVLEFSDDGISYARQSSRNRVTVDGAEMSGGSASVRSELMLGAIKLNFVRRPARPNELWQAPADAGARSQQAETVAFTVMDAEALRGAQRAAQRIEPPVEQRVEPPSTPSVRSIGVTPAVGISRIESLGAPSVPPPRVSRSDPPPPPPPPPLPRVARPSVPPGNELAHLYAGYRAAWTSVGAELVRQLEAAAVDARPALAKELQRTYPQITREPEFRELLKRLELKARRPEDPDIEAWLRRIELVLPPGVKIQSGFSTERLLQILEGYTGAFVDLNAAQEEVRRRSLGKLPRDSLLRQSDDPALVLAYLLNPGASWSSRFAELSAGIKDMVRHEWALMQATLEGARELLDALSPEAVAQKEGVELPGREGSHGRSFWQRGSGSSDAVAARLWYRFVEQFQGLAKGDQYQRTFLGARFSKRYTKAMGAGDKERPGKGTR